MEVFNSSGQYIKSPICNIIRELEELKKCFKEENKCKIEQIIILLREL
jgi:hypothetical protein